MVGARNDHEVARLRRARVQDRAVLHGDDLVGLAMNRQMTGDTDGGDAA